MEDCVLVHVLITLFVSSSHCRQVPSLCHGESLKPLAKQTRTLRFLAVVGLMQVKKSLSSTLSN
uniref:Uncharacterized protein n=1 Tax=Physcomitrium patens TaxID=3218 RepID=A0A2K1IF31_PHYPA|nr:hypothetical protein PHYPA_028474 [Physcomitrium patens]